MSADYRPSKYNPPSATKGDTYPAINFAVSFSGSKPDLARVRIKAKEVGGTSAALSLDSDSSGVTITDASTWAFTWDEISAITLDAGFYSVDFETTDAADGVRTYMSGVWQILPEVTD